MCELSLPQGRSQGELGTAARMPAAVLLAVLATRLARVRSAATADHCRASGAEH